MTDAQITLVHLITGLGTGGAETMLNKLVTRMDRRAFRNVVVSMTDLGTVGPAVMAAGVSVTALGMRRGLPDPRGLLRLLRLLRSERPAILQTWLYHADLLGTLAAQLAGVPRLAWNLRCSNMDLRHYSRLSQPLPRILALLSRLPDAVLVNSLAGRAAHERLGYRPRRWEFIANGFDLTAFRPDPQAGRRLRADLGLPNEAVIFGHVARFDPMKDHAGLLRAFSRVVSARAQARLLMIGQGVDEANAVLTREVAAHGLTDHVFMLGPRQEVAQWTAGFDVAVSSSTGEGFPNVVGEAMACAVPCLVTDVGDSALVVGHTGRVVPASDAGALSAAAIDLLDLGQEGRRQLGDAARARVTAEFSLQLVVQRYERLYRELSTGVDQGVGQCAA